MNNNCFYGQTGTKLKFITKIVDEVFDKLRIITTFIYILR